MQDIDQRDRELLGALQGDIPLSSTPYALIGQSIDMSEKEVIKRTERLKREGIVRQVAAHFDMRALGYRSCLVAAQVADDKIEQAAAATAASRSIPRKPAEKGSRRLNAASKSRTAPRSVPRLAW